MTKKLAISVLFVLSLLTVCLYGSMARYPEEWEVVQPGRNIENIKTAVPSIRLDKKDGGLNTWYHASARTRPLLITFNWRMDITTDNNGVVLYYNGR
ncbi:MAG: hypothetical protein GY859_33410, partial [Desulfobacterales bacterium]|nr:hypothetical protein [Desulfobacterales bacterium]